MNLSSARWENRCSSASPFMPSLIYPLNPAANTSIERDVVKNLFVAQLTPTPQNDSTVDEKPIVEKKIDQPVDDTSSTVQSGTVRINELFPNPKEKGEANEFIELYNFGTEDIDLAGFVLHDASATGKYILPAGSLLPKQAYFLVTREKSKLSLNNTDETISLFAPTSELLDAVTYATSKEGASLSYDGSGYRWSKYLTPGAANQFSDAPQIEQTKIPKKAYPNLPVLFSAKGDADETVVYLWDFGDGVKSRKQNVTHTYKKKGKYDGSLTLTGSLENSVKNFTVQVKKMPPQKVTITKVTPNPPGADAQGESLTVKNEGKKKIDLSGWSIATGTSKKKLANHPVRESFVLKSGEERVLTTDLAAFSLPNKIGFVELRQPDKKIAQKISYAKATGIKEGEVYQKQAGKMWAWANPVPVAMLAETKSSKSVALANNAEKTDATIAIQSEEKKPITLADLSPEDVATLKAQVKEELRQEVLAELAAQKAEGENSSEKASLEILPEKTAENVVETSTVLGAETEREGIAAEAVPAEKSTITSETITEKKNSAGWFSGIWQQTNGAVNKLLLQTQ